MQAQDIMTTNVITVYPDASIQYIAKRLIENRISAVPVVEMDGRLAGIVSEGDLMRRSEFQHRAPFLMVAVSPGEPRRNGAELRQGARQPCGRRDDPSCNHSQ